MENQSDVPNQQTNDRDSESTNATDSGELCTSKVRQRREDHADLPHGFYGGPLNDKTEYSVRGLYLNALYDTAVENFNKQSEGYGADSPALIYSQAFWNGYGAAISGVRDAIRQHPVE